MSFAFVIRRLSRSGQFPVIQLTRTWIGRNPGGQEILVRGYSRRIQKYRHQYNNCDEHGESDETPTQRFPPARRHYTIVGSLPLSEFLILDFGKNKVPNAFQGKSDKVTRGHWDQNQYGRHYCRT